MHGRTGYMPERLSRMLVSKSRAAGRRAEKAWRRRREHNRAAMRCDATRRDATDESGNTFPSSSSGSISICLLRLGCTCTPSNARQPCVQYSACVHGDGDALPLLAAALRCAPLSRAALPLDLTSPFALQPHARDLAGDGQIFSTGTEEAPVVYLQNNRVFFIYLALFEG